MTGTSRPKTMPQFGSLDELVEFFDTHDMGEYLEQMPEAHFEVGLKKRTHLFPIEEDLVEPLGEIARGQGISLERLINSWLREKALGKP